MLIPTKLQAFLVDVVWGAGGGGGGCELILDIEIDFVGASVIGIKGMCN